MHINWQGNSALAVSVHWMWDMKLFMGGLLRLRSHWYEYESRVRVSVYGSYKLHPYEWSVHGHYTSPHTSTRVYRQSPVGLKLNWENALRKKLLYTTTSLIIQLIAHLCQWIIRQWRNLWRKICVMSCINYFNTNFALFTSYGLDKNNDLLRNYSHEWNSQVIRTRTELVWMWTATTGMYASCVYWKPYTGTRTCTLINVNAPLVCST